MPAGIENNLEKIIFRTVGGVVFADTELQVAISETLAAGELIAKSNIMAYVYARPQGENTRYERTMTLFNSVKASRFFATGGQIYLSRQSYKKRYYPVYVDKGTMYMEGRDFWPPTRAEIAAILQANMTIAANNTARMLAEE